MRSSENDAVTSAMSGGSIAFDEVSLSVVVCVSRDFDVIGPCDKERRVILPVKSAFEQVCVGAIWGSVDVSDTSLWLRVVYLDTL